MSVPESPPMGSGRRRTRFAGPHARAARLVGVPSADVGTPQPTSPATWDQALVTVTGYPLVFVVGLGTRCWTLVTVQPVIGLPGVCSRAAPRRVLDRQGYGGLRFRQLGRPPYRDVAA